MPIIVYVKITIDRYILFSLNIFGTAFKWKLITLLSISCDWSKTWWKLKCKSVEGHLCNLLQDFYLGYDQPSTQLTLYWFMSTFELSALSEFSLPKDSHGLEFPRPVLRLTSERLHGFEFPSVTLYTSENFSRKLFANNLAGLFKSDSMTIHSWKILRDCFIHIHLSEKVCVQTFLGT